MSYSYADITTKNLENILKFLPFFANRQSKFFVNIEGVFNYTDEVRRFKKALNDEGFATASDWMKWNIVLGDFLEIPKKIEEADTATIQRLLTLILRSDGHVGIEGTRGILGRWIENGLILKILYRLEEILKEKQSKVK